MSCPLEVPLRRAGDVEEHEDACTRRLTLSGSEFGLSLNRAAAAVWDCCSGNRCAQDIELELENCLKLPSGVLRRDVASTLDALYSAGVLIAAPPRTATIDWERLAAPQEDGYDVGVVEENLAAVMKPVEAWSATTWFASCRLYEGLYSNPGMGLRRVQVDHPNLAVAIGLLQSRWQVGYATVSRLLRGAELLLDPQYRLAPDAYFAGSRCHSEDTPPLLGTMWSTANCPYMLAENLVHEIAHQKLFALGIGKESHRCLIENSAVHRFRSPVLTSRLRPMSALVHGIYAYAYVMQLDYKLLEQETNPRLRVLLADRISQNRDRLETGWSELSTHLLVDADGARFFDGLSAWVERLLLPAHPHANRGENSQADTPEDRSRMWRKCYRVRTSEQLRQVTLRSWVMPVVASVRGATVL